MAELVDQLSKTFDDAIKAKLADRLPAIADEAARKILALVGGCLGTRRARAFTRLEADAATKDLQVTSLYSLSRHYHSDPKHPTL